MGLASCAWLSLLSDRVAHTMGKISTHRWYPRLLSSSMTSLIAAKMSAILQSPAAEPYQIYYL